MMSAHTVKKYNATARTLHWIIFVLVALAVTLVEIKGFWPKGSATRNGLQQWHQATGVTILAVATLRLLWRFGHHTPPALASIAAWQEKLAQLMHIVLYGLLFLMPLSGLVAVMAKGQAINLFGLASFGPWLATDKALSSMVKGWHETGGTVVYWLVGLHAAAALWHHFVQKDDTLRRML